nr:amino acid adenylation domain-containing protein [Streptomyces sp. SID13588]
MNDLQQAYVLGQESFALGGQAQGYVEIEVADPDWDALESALNRVIRHQPMLRAAIVSDTHLEVVDSLPTYKIAPRRINDADAKAARLQATEAAKRPFDRTTRPLIRVIAYEVGSRVGRIHFAYDFAVMDSASVDVFLDEWARYYRQPRLEEAAYEFPYGTDEEHGADDRRRQAWEHWEERLAELPNAPRLGMPALADQSFTVMRTHQLSVEASTAIRDYAAAHRATVPALLVTMYADTLQLWTEDPRFLLTLTVLDRPAGADGIVGNFSTTVLVDITSIEPDFRARLADVQAKLWDGLQHRSVSGVAVGRELQRRRHTVEPIAPVVFTSLLGTTVRDEPLGKVVGYDSHTPQALLDLVASERDGALRLTLYAQDDPGFRFVAEGLWNDLLAWLAQFADTAAGGTAGLPPRSASSVERAPSPPPAGRFASLSEIAASLPGADDDLALASSHGAALPRAELRRRVALMADGLIERGAGPGVLVAIAVPRNLEQYVLALAVACTGAAYVPIDVALPIARQEQILAQAGPDLLVVDPDATSLTAPADGVTVGPRDLSRVTDRRPDRFTRTSVPTDLAYVLYTSGSTGEPKGVAMSGAAAVNTLNDIVERFNVRSGDRVASTAQLGFDLSVFDLFGALMAGGSVVVADGGLEREPEALLRLMHETRATIWNSVPAVFEILIQHLEDAGERLPPYLRLVMLSGDVIAPTLPGRVWALADPTGPRPVVVALGGATEAGIWSNAHLMGPDDPQAPRLSYGRALQGQVLEVVDFAKRPRPAGIVGEIVIGGGSLADGYWRDAELTGRRFFGDGATGNRRYLTGDLGYIRSDGVVEILGRSDRQVKINGQRIELGDVEAAILQVPGVRSAVVSVAGPPGRAWLRAHVAGTVTRADDVAEFVRGRLPGHMVPKSWLLLPAFPLTGNGKIDHPALTAMEEAPSAPAPGTPLGATESWLAQLWRHVLDVDFVGAEDNFFELGGDSLLATRLRSRVAKEHGVRITVRELFTSVDLREMAKRVDRAGPARGVPGSHEDAVRRAVVEVLRRRSGASEAEIRDAADLFDVGILTSHSVASAAVDLEERYSVDLLGDFRASQWTHIDSIVDLLLGKGARR